MNLSPEEFLIICKSLALVAAGVSECGYINISPLKFGDKADFHANIEASAMVTQKAIERSEIAFTTLTLAKAPQKPEGHGEPWVYTFNFNVFRESGNKRLDESLAPDEFQKKVLKSYFDFVTAILNLNAAFGSEETAISDLDEERIVEATAKLADDQDETIQEDEPGRYIEAVSGFSANLAVEVSITFKECGY